MSGPPRAQPSYPSNNGYGQARSDYHDAYAPQTGGENSHSAAAAGAPSTAAPGADPYAPCEFGPFDRLWPLVSSISLTLFPKGVVMTST